MIKNIPVSSYIDPGTGSFIFQILTAFILTAVISIRRIFRFLRNLITKFPARKKKIT